VAMIFNTRMLPIKIMVDEREHRDDDDAILRMPNSAGF
jgi:hypothetical protein